MPHDPRRIRVLLADDNRTMLDTVAGVLESEFEVVGAVENGRDLVDAEASLNPDIGVIDMSMPVMHGLDAAHELKRRGSSMKIIFLTVNEDADYVKAAVDAGAVGYVVKRQMVTDLPKALKEVIQGGTYFSALCPMSRTA